MILASKEVVVQTCEKDAKYLLTESHEGDCGSYQRFIHTKCEGANDFPWFLGYHSHILVPFWALDDLCNGNGNVKAPINGSSTKKKKI